MEELENFEKKWKHWHYHAVKPCVTCGYKNTFLLILSLALFFFFVDTPFVKNFISYVGNFGYFGAFLAGVLFVSIFTVAPASVVLFYLAETLDPFFIAVAAGFGGMVGDYLIFRYIKDRIFEELKPIYMENGGKPLRKLFRTPYFAWTVPIVGAIIIASPFPDEVGLGLMGLSKMKTWQFLGLLFLLDMVGIFLIITAAKSF